MQRQEREQEREQDAARLRPALEERQLAPAGGAAARRRVEGEPGEAGARGRDVRLRAGQGGHQLGPGAQRQTTRRPGDHGGRRSRARPTSTRVSRSLRSRRVRQRGGSAPAVTAGPTHFVRRGVAGVDRCICIDLIGSSPIHLRVQG